MILTVHSLTTLSAILIRDTAWLIPAVLWVIVAGVVLTWGYRRAGSMRGRWLPAILKATGFALIAFFLLNPLWTQQTAVPRANLFVTLIDNSRSMSVRDGDDEDAESRAQLVLKSLTGEDAEDPTENTRPIKPIGDSDAEDETVDGADNDDANRENDANDKTEIELAPPALAAWRIQLDEQFDSRTYAFDTRLGTLDNTRTLIFDGRGSSLVTALRQIRDRYRGRPLAGILVLTDGNATDVPAGGLDLTDLPPIYPVIVGDDDDPPADLGVASVAVSQTAFEDAPVTVQTDVNTTGFADTRIQATLLDENGDVVEQQTQTPGEDEQSLAFRFQLKPTATGVTFYRMQVRPLSDDDEPRAEATTLNNDRTIMVDRGRGPYRVLYVAGRPNWEYKFLNRALAEDEQINLVGLIRIADREPKFAWRSGRDGDRSNPLFKGFDNKADDAEEYDEAVTVRLNVEDESELAGGKFPNSAEALFRYHAIVLDDVEARFFTRDQLALLEKFVTQRRGGLLMLGGAESLRQGEYARTPIGRMLPVYLDREAAATPAGPYRIELTREGRHEQWTRLRGTEIDERNRLTAMPDFLTLNEVSGIKPGATVLATARDAAGVEWPALVVQPFGGRVAVSTVGDYWRWALKRDEEHAEDQPKMWRQTLRWLVADVPPRLQITAEPMRDDPAAPMRLDVRLRDETFEPIENAAVRIRVKSPDGAPLELTAEPSLDEAGLYSTTYLPRSEGAYLATARAVDAAGESLGKADVGWAVNPAGDEFRSLRPNRQLLETLAQRTGGEVIELDDLDDFVDSLPARESPVMELSVQPLWHQWWMLLLAVACLVGEWGLRRVRGLP